MSKIKIEEIRKEAEQHGWEVLSDTYQNLNTEMIFKCDEGHQVFAPFKNIRNRWICPICERNQFKNQKLEVVPKKDGVIRVLALDQATHISGYSVFDDGQLIKSGTFQTSLSGEIERDNMIKMWVLSMIEAFKPDIVGLEDIQLQQFEGRSVGVTTYKTLAHLQGILMEAIFEAKIDYKVVPPATWRAHCGVKGRTKADKKSSMQFLVKQWYDVSVTNDESDAIGIGKYVSDNFGKKVKIMSWE